MQSTISQASLEQASLNKATFEDRVRAIRSNPRLSDAGKTEEIVKLHQEAVARAERIEADRVANKTTRRAKLEQRYLALKTYETSDPSTVIAFRDSQDRVERLTNEQDAVAALQRAQRTGDELMARAILSAAFEPSRQWAEVVNTYTTANPTTYNDLEELWAIAWEDSGKLNAADLTALLENPTTIRTPREVNPFSGAF